MSAAPGEPGPVRRRHRHPHRGGDGRQRQLGRQQADRLEQVDRVGDAAAPRTAPRRAPRPRRRRPRPALVRARPRRRGDARRQRHRLPAVPLLRPAAAVRRRPGRVPRRLHRRRGRRRRSASPATSPGRSTTPSTQPNSTRWIATFARPLRHAHRRPHAEQGDGGGQLPGLGPAGARQGVGAGDRGDGRPRRRARPRVGARQQGSVTTSASARPACRSSPPSRLRRRLAAAVARAAAHDRRTPASLLPGAVLVGVDAVRAAGVQPALPAEPLRAGVRAVRRRRHRHRHPRLVLHHGPGDRARR